MNTLFTSSTLVVIALTMLTATPSVQAQQTRQAILTGRKPVAVRTTSARPAPQVVRPSTTATPQTAPAVAVTNQETGYFSSREARTSYRPCPSANERSHRNCSACHNKEHDQTEVPQCGHWPGCLLRRWSAAGRVIRGRYKKQYLGGWLGRLFPLRLQFGWLQMELHVCVCRGAGFVPPRRVAKRG